MSNPFSLLPFAIASAGGYIANQPVGALVAAGVTLLQRCAPLVRRLAVEPPALLLPRGPALVTALAACDGHAVLVVDATLPIAQQTTELATAPFGVLFTIREHAGSCPAGVMIVLLDDVPASAAVQFDGQERVVDLGSHVGLALEGERGAAGSDEPLLRFVHEGSIAEVSHAAMMLGDGPAWLGPWLRELLAGGQVR